jgi:putative DNA primase/helicase
VLGSGAVRLGAAGELLGVAEGVETGLSAMQISGVPVWCCLMAGRMHRVAIPLTVRELHIFADDDEPGRAAAERTAELHTTAGRRVVLRFPPAGCKDWNDALVAASCEVAA